MYKLICMVVSVFVITGCSKEKKPAPLVNNNEVNATITHSNGSLVSINARGEKAILGLRSPLGGPGYVYGSNTANNAVAVSLFPSITATGNFNFSNGYQCGYRANTSIPGSPIFDNTNVNGGSISITSLRDDYIEGSFNAICRNGTDSVIVTGNFKGNIIAK